LAWEAETAGSWDSFNPLDVTRLGEGHAQVDLALLLDPVFDREKSFSDVTSSRMPPGEIWMRLARTFLPAVIRTQLRPNRAPSLIESFYPLLMDDIIYNLAKLLDMRGKTLDPNDYSIISSFLQLSDDQRSALLSALAPSIEWVNNPQVQRLTERTSFELLDLVEGSPVVLIDVPHEAGDGGTLLARLWLSAFIRLASSRKTHRDPTLLVADGARDPKLLPQLLAAQRLPAGLLDVWTFWESVDQMQVPFPADWAAFVDSCDSIEAAGPQGPVGVRSLAQLLGADSDALSKLTTNDTLLLRGTQLTIPRCEDGESAAFSLRGHSAFLGGGSSNKWDFIAAEIAARPRTPVIVFESAGTWFRRLEVGRSGPTIRLDPYQLAGAGSDKFNPWDAYALLDKRFGGSHRLAEALVTAGLGSIDPFWRHASTSLIRATLQYLVAVPEKQVNLSGVLDVLTSEDPIYNLAVVLDTIGAKLPRWCYQDISGFLQLADATRKRVLAEARKDLTSFNVGPLRNASDRTSFDVEKLLDGPSTVFIGLGDAADWPGKVLARLWLSAFVQLIALRGTSEPPVLLIVDAVNDSGLMKQLLAAQRLPRGAVDVWSFWETVDQLRATHPAEWSAFVDNCDGIVAMGPLGLVGAGGLAEVFKVDRKALLGIAPGETLLLAGTAPMRPKLEAQAFKAISRPGHVAIFASAASSKWDYITSAIAARPQSPLVVLETSGECYRRTASGRRGRVIRLDPYQVIGPGGDQFNPLTFPLTPSASFEQATHRIIAALLPTDYAFNEPYWQSAGSNLLHALTRCMAVQHEPTAGELRRLTLSDEVKAMGKLAEEAKKDPDAKHAAAVLTHVLARPDGERTSLFAVVSQALYDFGDPAIDGAMSHSSFNPGQTLSTDGSAIYIEMPLMDGEPGRRLVRLWLEALLPFMRASPAKPLVVVDSPLSEYVSSTLVDHRHEGRFDVMAIWDTPAQLMSRGPSDWDAYLSSLGHAAAIGPLNRHAALRISMQFGRPVEALEMLADGEFYRLC
jgi:type IV secretion system protein VirD4